MCKVHLPRSGPNAWPGSSVPDAVCMACVVLCCVVLGCAISWQPSCHLNGRFQKSMLCHWRSFGAAGNSPSDPASSSPCRKPRMGHPYACSANNLACTRFWTHHPVTLNLLSVRASKYACRHCSMTLKSATGDAAMLAAVLMSSQRGSAPAAGNAASPAGEPPSPLQAFGMHQLLSCKCMHPVSVAP